MKPAPFTYFAPASADEALALLDQHGFDAKLLAGGQSLIPAMNFRLAQPTVLIDLNAIPALAYVRPQADGGLAIGAMTRHSTIEHDPLVAGRAPLLRAIAPHIAHTQIRHRGTFGGSLAHADPSAHWPAAALALQARLRIKNSGSERWVSADDFFASLFTTVMEANEMLLEVTLPPLPPRHRVGYQQVSRQHGAFPLAGVAAIVALDERNRCQFARLVFVGAGEKPLIGVQAAKVLLGQPPAAGVIAAAAEAAARFDVDPGSDIHASAAYRRHLIEVLTRRVLHETLSA